MPPWVHDSVSRRAWPERLRSPRRRRVCAGCARTGVQVHRRRRQGFLRRHALRQPQQAAEACRRRKGDADGPRTFARNCSTRRIGWPPRRSATRSGGGRRARGAPSAGRLSTSSTPRAASALPVRVRRRVEAHRGHDLAGHGGSITEEVRDEEDVRPDRQGGDRHRRQWRHRPRHGAGPRVARRDDRRRGTQPGEDRGGRAGTAGARRGGERSRGRRAGRSVGQRDGRRCRRPPRTAGRARQQRRHQRPQAAARAVAGGVARSPGDQPDQRLSRQPRGLSAHEERAAAARS